MSGISSGVADQLKLQLPSWLNMMQLIGFSKDFFELVRDIGEAKSKEEEERIIKNEAQKLKISMSQPDQSRHKMKEYLIRTMYCVMLGHDIPFAYVHALTMTQDPKIYNKRTGYLAVSLCLHENHELLLMVVNSIQKGLLSTNYLEVSSALIALCKLINQDTIPAFLPTVVNLLAHPKAVVRKKACMAVHRFWLKSPESISHLADKLRVVLCDRDPSVMAASLCLFLDMARVDTAPFKDLIPSFVSILKQVSENRLPRSYEYHGVPAPWIQINLLKLLALLGEGDQTASEHMYEVLLQSLQRAEKHKNNAGYAVLFEAIMSITRIRANNPLLEAAANSIGQLIRVRNHNLKYLGIQALAAIVRVAPRFVAPHQMEVIECLESTDESIKRKTLDLLYRMTNTKNVVVIVAKLIEYLQNTVATDELVRAELVSRINELAERYAPNNHWYIDTMNIMLQLGGTLVRPEVAYNLIRLISQGSGNSEEEDMQLRHYAVTTFLKSLESGDTLPDIQVQVLAWVVSEYGYLATDDGSGVTLLGIVTRFADLMERPHTDVTTRGWILTGLLKLAAQLDQIPPSIITLTQKYTRSRHPDLMMRAYEFLALVHNPVLMGEVLPVDASCEDLEVDPKLSFLNAYASRGVATGVFKPYIPREARQPLSASLSSPSIPIASSSAYTSSKKELNFSYPAPPPPSNTVSITGTISHQTAVPSPITSQPSSAPNTPPPSRAELPLSPEAPISTLQQLKVPNAGWTREGFQGKTTTTTPVSVQPQAASTPAPATVPSTAMYNKPASSAPPKGPTTPKMNEKQASLANQLFSGLSLGDSATSNYAPAANSYAPSAKTAPKPRNPPQTKPTSAPSTPTITPTTPPATRNNIPNISKTASTSSMPTSLGFTPSQPPTPTTSSSDFLIDLADLGSAFSSSGSLKSSTPLNTSAPLKTSTPSPLPTSPISSPINPHRSSEIPSLMDDVIISNQPTIPSYGSSDNVLAPSAPLASQITPGNFDVSNLSYTPFLGSIFDGSPSTPAESVGKPDENLHVGCAKVMRADETLLVFLLGNKSTQTLTDVVTSIKVPEHFSVELAADPVVQVSGHTFTLSTLPPGKAALQAVRLKHKKLGFNMAVIAQVQYSCEGRRTNIADCNVHVEISDLLRPHVITIDQVGKVWHTYNQETKTKITPSKVETSKALLERLASEMGVHIVQVIGNEGIAAGRLLSGAGQVSGSVLLMHVQVGPQPVGGQAVDVTVRTKDKSFTEVVVRHIHKIIR